MTLEVIVARLSDETLEELMTICHARPTEPDVCVCCAAYMEMQRRDTPGRNEEEG